MIDKAFASTREHIGPGQTVEEYAAIFSALARQVIIYDADGSIARGHPGVPATPGSDLVGMEAMLCRLKIRRPDGTLLSRDELPGYRALMGETVAGERLDLTGPKGRRMSVVVSASPIIRGKKICGSAVVWQEIPELQSPENDREHESRVAGIVRDVSEKRPLYESEQKYRYLSENLNEGIWAINPDGVTTFASPRMAEILGCRASDITGEEIYSFMEGRRAKRFARLLRKMRECGRQQMECDLHRSDGTIVHTLMVISPFSGENEPASRAIAGVLDITKRKHAEEALRESEKKFRGIAERSFDMIFTLDRKGYITYVSPAVRRLLGYSPGEITGRDCVDFVVPALRNEYRRFSTLLRQGREVGGLQLELLRKDGTHVFFEINASPIMRGRTVIGIQGVGRDITERIRIEELRKQAYDRLGKNIEQFAVLGDHIRQPLQVIRGMAGLIEDEKTAVIDQQVERINDIIRQLDSGWVESRKVREYLRRYE